ncbi:MAG: aldolase/citrate lyase family protein [Ardenticatenaceae bacterium]|nr:aldolase/citrate lyase family protein [Ardenticatenaceae bacterium]
MYPNRLKSLLRDGQPVFGTFVSLPEPGIVEAIGYAGYDFVILDMEHSPIDFSALPTLLAAAEAAGVVPLVRVGTCDANPILRVLDSGAMGVIAPHVRTKADAEALVRACRYPRRGNAGALGGSRAARYGKANFAEHARLSNDEVLTIALIEDVEGVDAIEEIVEVQGLDIICPGAGDLSASLGYLGQPQHPAVQEQVERVAATVRVRPELTVGYMVMAPEQITRCQELDARFIIFSQDTRVLFGAYRGALAELRERAAMP